MKRVMESFAGWDQLILEVKLTKPLSGEMQVSCITLQG